MADPDLFAGLERLWSERRSVRAFLPEPLDRATLERIFTVAQRAPSWCNTQPWRAWVTMPPATAALSAAMIEAAKSASPEPDVPFPPDYPSPHKEHRKACGLALYKEMGIAKDDAAGRFAAWLRNYAFFDAPHVAVIACDRRLGPYAYVDVGVWLGFVLTAADALGVATCPMASTAAYARTLRAHLPIPDTDIVLFGLALGRPDPDAPANRCRTTREALGANVAFVDGTGAAAQA